MLATPADLGSFLGAELTDTQEDRAALLLTLATGKIQAHCRQTLERVDDDAVVLTGNWGHGLVLPEWPVLDVTTVTVDGYVYADQVDRTFDGLHTIYRGRVRFTPDGDPAWPDTSLHWGGPDTQIAVVYSHGFDEIPDALRAVCLEVTARAWSNPIAANSETIGAYSVTHAATQAALELTKADRRALHDYRRRW